MSSYVYRTLIPSHGRCHCDRRRRTGVSTVPLRGGPRVRRVQNQLLPYSPIPPPQGLVTLDPRLDWVSYRRDRWGRDTCRERVGRYRFYSSGAGTTGTDGRGLNPESQPVRSHASLWSGDLRGTLCFGSGDSSRDSRTTSGEGGGLPSFRMFPLCA